MAILRLGDISFGIGADSSGLRPALDDLKKLGEAVDAASKKTSDAGRKMFQTMMNRQSQAVSRMQQGLSAMTKLGREGGPAEMLQRAEVAMNRLQAAMNKAGSKTTNSAIKQLSREIVAFEAEIKSLDREWSGMKLSTKNFQSAEDAIHKAGLRLTELNARIQQKSGNVQSMQANVAAFKALEDAVTTYGVKSSQAREATRVFERQLQSAKLAMKGFKEEGQGSNLPVFFRNLSSSVSLLLGPMNVLGARFSAFNSIADRSGVAIGGIVAVAAIAAVSMGALSVATVKVGIEMSRLEARFEALAQVGGQGAGASLAALADISDRAGTVFLSTAESFTRLEAAAAGTALEGTKIIDIFDDFTTTAARFQLSNEQITGTLRAFEQMLSKGTVQAEELRGQLGDRLPGAFNIAAKAMGVTTRELNGMLRRGEVLANDFLPKFVAEFKKAFGTTAPVDSMQASMNRLTNAGVSLLTAFDNAFQVTDTFKAAVNAMTGILLAVSNNMDMLVASVNALSAALGAGLAAALIVLNWGKIVAGLMAVEAGIVAAATAMRAFSIAALTANLSMVRMMVTTRALSAALLALPWVRIAQVALILGTAILAGVGAFQSSASAMSENGKRAKAMQERLDELGKQYDAVKEKTKDGIVIKDITDVEILEAVQKRMSEIGKQIAEFTARKEKAGSGMFVSDSDGIEIGKMAFFIKKLKGELKGLENDEENVKLAIEATTRAMRDRISVAQQMGTLLNSDAKRSVDVLNQQADAALRGKYGLEQFNSQLELSDKAFSMIKDSVKESGIGLLEKDIRAVADTLAGIKNEDFALLNAKRLFGTPEEQKAAHLLSTALWDVQDALQKMRAGDASRMFTEIADQSDRAAKRIAAIGKSNFANEMMESGFAAEDAVKPIIKELVQLGFTTDEARGKVAGLRGQLTGLGQGRALEQMNRHFAQMVRDVDDLNAATQAALGSDLGFAQFERFGSIAADVRDFNIELQQQYGNTERVKQAVQEYTDSLWANARAMQAREQKQFTEQTVRDISRMQALTEAMNVNERSVNRLNDMFDQQDQIRGYSDQLIALGVNFETYSRLLTVYANSLDAYNQKLRESGSYMQGWTDSIKQAVGSGLDGVMNDFWTIIDGGKEGWESLGDVAMRVADDIFQSFMALNLINPLKNMMGADLPTAFGKGATQMMGGLFGGGEGGVGGAAGDVGADTAAALIASMGQLDAAAMQTSTTLATQLSTQAAAVAQALGIGATAATAEQSVEATLIKSLIFLQLSADAAATALASLAAKQGAGEIAGLIGGAAGGAPAAGARGLVLGRPKMMGKGGVLNRATYFPDFHTVGGEAGPEGLLPLQRMSNGKLGVHSGGGSKTVVEQLNAQFGDILIMDGSDPRRVQRSITQGIAQAERSRRMVARNVR